MKKILITFIATTFLLASCSNDVVIANKSFIDSLENVNNELLLASEDINGDIAIEVAAGLNYKSSSIEVGLRSDSKNNSAYYDTEISAETIVYLLNSISKREKDNSQSFSSILLYSNNGEKSLTDGGNKSDNILSFNAKALEKFYKGNQLYLASDDNKAVLGTKLNEYNIQSGLGKSGSETQYITTMDITTTQLAQMVPFINIDEKEYDGNITLRFYQDSESDLINKLDVLLYDYSFTSENDIAYVNVDIVLSFTLPIGGEEDE